MIYSEHDTITFAGFIYTICSDFRELLISPPDNSLIKTIKKYHPSLVVFDPFVGIHGAEENSSGGMRDVMKGLRDIANEGPAVIVVHHHTKSDRGTDSQKLRGSSDIKAAVDSHIVITKKGKFLNISQNKCRYYFLFTPFAVKLEGDKESKKAFFTYHEYKPEQKKESRDDRAKREILSMFKKGVSLGREAVCKSLKEKVGIGKNKTNDLLTELFEANQINQSNGIKNKISYTSKQ